MDTRWNGLGAALVAVCEDDRALRSVLRRAIESGGYAVTATATAGELLLHLEPVPQLLVVDVGLPDADGRDLCLVLRARGVTAPVLLLTAFDGASCTGLDSFLSLDSREP